ncbi:MAG: asparagine synthase (glutamine-hydrolyzing), partial [Hyphomicrobium sp.]
HRGPDDKGYLFAPGLGLASRRLSIVGLGDGNQPIFNEDRTLAVVYNGELFDYPERKAELEAKGHVFRTHTDTEIIVHLYEEHGEDVFQELKGQFALALVDFTKRTVFLARDRVGICPLHWSQQGDWLVFGSEIKALLASGEVAAAADPRGLDHMFTFFAMGARRTMFEGVNSLLPGHYLKIEFRQDARRTEIRERRYWDFDFPDAGQEEDPEDSNKLIEDFEATFRRAVEIRLRADVPVVGYLSGGVDSAYVLANASKVRGSPVPSFTIQVPGKGLDEKDDALVTARHLGSQPTILRCDSKVITDAYPRLISAADCPVIDTSCAALWCLANEVHNQGYKVALTGEGSDEAFAGYVWFKMRNLTYWLDFAGSQSSDSLSRFIRKRAAPGTKLDDLRRIDATVGGAHAQMLLYHLVSQSRDRYFSADLKDRLGDKNAYEDLSLDLERMRRWSPLNQSLYFGYKVMLAGLLMNHKGDRIAMANSVETRYPFLDDDVIAFASRLHPRWKLRGLTRDKYLLRQAAARMLPKEVAFRPKGMFRAPMAETFLNDPPPFVQQLISEEALRKTGYFDVEAVRRDIALFGKGKTAKLGTFANMGLNGVLATQLWHHLYLDGSLCDLPNHEPKPHVERPNNAQAAA